MGLAHTAYLCPLLTTTSLPSQQYRFRAPIFGMSLPPSHGTCHDCTVFSLKPTEQQQKQPFNGRLSGTTRVGRYQKKHSPAYTHSGQRTSFITFLHLQRSTASSLFSLCAWESSWTTSFQVLFGLPFGLEPSSLKQTETSRKCQHSNSIFCFEKKVY